MPVAFEWSASSDLPADDEPASAVGDRVPCSVTEAGFFSTVSSPSGKVTCTSSMASGDPVGVGATPASGARTVVDVWFCCCESGLAVLTPETFTVSLLPSLETEPSTPVDVSVTAAFPLTAASAPLGVLPSSPETAWTVALEAFRLCPSAMPFFFPAASLAGLEVAGIGLASRTSSLIFEETNAPRVVISPLLNTSGSMSFKPAIMDSRKAIPSGDPLVFFKPSRWDCTLEISVSMFFVLLDDINLAVPNGVNFSLRFFVNPVSVEFVCPLDPSLALPIILAIACPKFISAGCISFPYGFCLAFSSKAEASFL